MKYLETAIVLSEIPDHITLAINISGCPIHCPECHSKYLWEDVGEELNESSLTSLIENNPDVDCICFMGGDSDPMKVATLAKFVHETSNLKTAWYSGRDMLPQVPWEVFDYIKIGSYKSDKGPLNSKTTNQRMYKVVTETNKSKLVDITNRFWNA